MYYDIYQIIIIFLLGLVDHYTLKMPTIPRDRARVTKKPKFTSEMISQVISTRDSCVGSLIPVATIRSTYISVYSIVLSDIGLFYAQVNKVTDKDQGKSLTLFTQGRLNAFRSYASLRKKKMKQATTQCKVGDNAISKLRKRALAMTKRMKWEVSESEEDYSEDSDEETVGSCDSMLMDCDMSNEL